MASTWRAANGHLLNLMFLLYSRLACPEGCFVSEHCIFLCTALPCFIHIWFRCLLSSIDFCALVPTPLPLPPSPRAPVFGFRFGSKPRGVLRCLLYDRYDCLEVSVDRWILRHDFGELVVDTVTVRAGHRLQLGSDVTVPWHKWRGLPIYFNCRQSWFYCDQAVRIAV